MDWLDAMNRAVDYLEAKNARPSRNKLALRLYKNSLLTA